MPQHTSGDAVRESAEVEVHEDAATAAAKGTECSRADDKNTTDIIHLGLRSQRSD